MCDKITSRTEYKHVSFNPSFPSGVMGLPTTLSTICSDQERDGWVLLRIIYYSSYETVAVFERG